MKLVIEIPEDVYTRLFDNGIQDNEIAVDDVCEMARALRLGTPLPKRHEDCVSRQAAIDELYKMLHDCFGADDEELDAVITTLNTLPFVTPAEKVGRWIDDNKDEIDAQYGRHLYRCQICNKYAEYFVGGTEDWWDIEKPNYCPSCGAKMEGEE